MKDINTTQELSEKEKIQLYMKTYGEKNKEHRLAMSKSYYKQNKNRYNELSRNHYRKTKKVRKEYAQQYYSQNKEEQHKRCKEWYQKNKVKLKPRQRELYIKNKEKINQRSKNRALVDPAYKIRGLISRRINRAIKFSNTTKAGHTIELLGCSYKEAREYLEKLFEPGMSWENHGVKGWHIDHIKPCAAFDLTNPDEQKKCFHYTNLRPLWSSLNTSKNSMYNGVRHYINKGTK